MTGNKRRAAREPHYAKMAKSIFVAPPGRVIWQADFSTLEVRIAAMLSGDQDTGEKTTEKRYKVTPMDRHVLETWMTMLADLGDKLPGWVPNA